ncbi:hypothetical protein [Micromonospora craniellae]|uniref:Uncharacterized protein n=1 Tax=Micromonospora craniellae TaxID=2294034 RepID=A0A372G2L6_9ACTN|nr:hypothetical protein [Micromonospora craniellae]QOC89858.1 hypothetical protein ID554_16605 [Micromonospora craniellae]RFS47006.1 hypothetical protein D0Q02_07535 [Micromonospora craniellae]
MTADVIELTERSTEQAARARADRIRKGLIDYLETVEEFALAFERRDWQVLGHDSWEAYLAAEFGADRLRVPEVHRTQAVTVLRMVGMSTRAIGSALGISKDTAARALAAVSADGALPATVRGLDGRDRPATRPAPAPTPVVIEERGPTPGEQVWIAAARKGIPGHALKTKTSTRCSRSTRNGLTLPAEQARERHSAVWCHTCWPEEEETTRFVAGESEAHDPRVSDEAGAECRDSAPADVDLAAAVLAALEGTGPYGLTLDEIRNLLPGAPAWDEVQRVVDELTALKVLFTATTPTAKRWIPSKVTATGHFTSSPVDGEDVDSEAMATTDTATDGPVDHAAPAPVPPAAASPAVGGTGVTPRPDWVLTVDQVARLRAVFEWARAGLARHPRYHDGCGEPGALGREYAGERAPRAPHQIPRNGEQVAHVEVSWALDGEMEISYRSDRYVLAETTLWMPGVDEALDVLCALGILPGRFSRQYAAGLQAGLRAGDAIDGPTEETDHG